MSQSPCKGTPVGVSARSLSPDVLWRLPRIARKLYLSIAVPRFTYAVDVWFTPIVPTSVTGGSRLAGSVGFARKLATIQSTAARAILGALRSTPVAHLDAFASLLPMQYLLNETCQRAATRLASAPDNHPLRTDIDRALIGRKTHVPPLQNILCYVKIAPVTLERWTFKDCNRSPLTVPLNYFPSSADAVMEARRDHSRVKVFSDGSKSKDGIGAGAVLKLHNRVCARSGARLGDHDMGTVLEAELAGILVATQLILRLRVIEDASIYCDSQLAVACVEGAATGAPKALLRAIKGALGRIRERRDCTDFSLKWCPARRGIGGCLLADHEAKLAAREETYPQDLVPRLLVNYRPQITRTLFKTLLKENNRYYALDGWNISNSGQKLLSHLPTIRPDDFLRNTANLNRSQATFLFRLITGHVQLRKHVHRIQIEDSPICEGCNHAYETVTHFVLRCPRYAMARQDVLITKGHEYLNISFLFSSRSGIKALLEYGRRTRRFHDILR